MSWYAIFHEISGKLINIAEELGGVPPAGCSSIYGHGDKPDPAHWDPESRSFKAPVVEETASAAGTPEPAPHEEPQVSGDEASTQEAAQVQDVQEPAEDAKAEDEGETQDETQETPEAPASEDDTPTSENGTPASDEEGEDLH